MFLNISLNFYLDILRCSWDIADTPLWQLGVLLVIYLFLSERHEVFNSKHLAFPEILHIHPFDNLDIYGVLWFSSAYPFKLPKIFTWYPYQYIRNWGENLLATWMHIVSFAFIYHSPIHALKVYITDIPFWHHKHK